MSIHRHQGFLKSWFSLKIRSQKSNTVPRRSIPTWNDAAGRLIVCCESFHLTPQVIRDILPTHPLRAPTPSPPQPQRPSALLVLVPSLPDSYRAISSKSLLKYHPPNEACPNCHLLWQSFLLPFVPKASCCVYNSPWRQTGTQNTHQRKQERVLIDFTNANAVCV